MTTQNLKTIQELIHFYTEHMKETYDTMYDFYNDNEELIILERDVEQELYTPIYKSMKTPKRKTKWYFKMNIENFEDLETFFYHLNKDELLYHPEDDPYSVMNKEGRVFTNEECEYLNKRIEEVYTICSDPCEYIHTTFYNQS